MVAGAHWEGGGADVFFEEVRVKCSRSLQFRTLHHRVILVDTSIMAVCCCGGNSAAIVCRQVQDFGNASGCSGVSEERVHRLIAIHCLPPSSNIYLRARLRTLQPGLKEFQSAATTTYSRRRRLD